MAKAPGGREASTSCTSRCQLEVIGQDRGDVVLLAVAVIVLVGHQGQVLEVLRTSEGDTHDGDQDNQTAKTQVQQGQSQGTAGDW